MPLQLRVCELQLPPQATLLAAYAVVLEPLAIEPPHGKQHRVLQLLLVYEPLSALSLQVRVCDEQAVPHEGAELE